METGEQVWQSDYIGDEDESLYGHQPFNGRMVGANGILYISSDTVYQLMPRTRFHVLVAVNETTGDFLWKLDVGAKPRSIANGYLVATDGENGIQYCIGKGQTSTSITAPLTAVTLGNTLVLQGNVFDISSGASDSSIMRRFPNGLAAVSDADMSTWMDYVYCQNATLINDPPLPAGVTVRLSIVDPNNNCMDIGTATSDSSGMFSTMWEPEIPGKYTVYATFDGSDGYYGSYSETTVGVIEAAAAPTPTTSTVNSEANNNMTMAILGVGIAILVAIVLSTLVILKKR